MKGKGQEGEGRGGRIGAHPPSTNPGYTHGGCYTSFAEAGTPSIQCGLDQGPPPCQVPS